MLPLRWRLGHQEQVEEVVTIVHLCSRQGHTPPQSRGQSRSDYQLPLQQGLKGIKFGFLFFLFSLGHTPGTAHGLLLPLLRSGVTPGGAPRTLWGAGNQSRLCARPAPSLPPRRAAARGGRKMPGSAYRGFTCTGASL